MDAPPLVNPREPEDEAVEVPSFLCESDEDEPGSELPTFQVNHSFLEDNAQSHTSAMSAFGDVLDNAKESGARRVRVDVSSARKQLVLRIRDDGRGMSEAEMRHGLMSIGYTKKDLSTGKHYGFGAKTALPRLAEYALIFTRSAAGRHRTVGLLSSAFSKAVAADSLRVPLFSWEADADQLVQGSHADAPLKTRQRQASLDALLQCNGLPYANEQQLLSEFSSPAGVGKSGTLIVMWAVRSDVQLKHPGDVRLSSKARHALPHEVSLRAYVEVLYLKHSEMRIAPSMAVWVKGSEVKPRDWAVYLKDMRRHATLTPPAAHSVKAQFEESHSAVAAACAREARAWLNLGYARDLREVVDHCERGATKELMEETGVFVYHKGRLTRALEKTGIQTRKIGSALTTRLRLLTLALGLTGFIEENYLVQHHTKSEYSPHAATMQLFGRLMEEANLQMQRLINPEVVRRYCEVKQMNFSEIRTSGICMGFSKGLWKALVGGGPGGTTMEELEDVRMRPLRRSDTTVGRVELMPGHAKCRLRLEDGSLSARTYFAHDLEPTHFDPAMLSRHLRPAPASLVGCVVEVPWRGGEEGEVQYYPASLQPPQEARGPGWFTVQYEDASELVFVALDVESPAGGAVAFRVDGEPLRWQLSDEASIGRMREAANALRRKAEKRRNGRHENEETGDARERKRMRRRAPEEGALEERSLPLEVPLKEVPPPEEVPPLEEVPLQEVPPPEEVPPLEEVPLQEVPPPEEVPPLEEVPLQEVPPPEEVPPEEVPLREVPPLEDMPLDEVPFENGQLEDAMFEEAMFEEVMFEEVPSEEVPYEDGPLEDGPSEDGPREDGPREKGVVQPESVQQQAVHLEREQREGVRHSRVQPRRVRPRLVRQETGPKGRDDSALARAVTVECESHSKAIEELQATVRRYKEAEKEASKAHNKKIKELEACIERYKQAEEAPSAAQSEQINALYATITRHQQAEKSTNETLKKVEAERDKLGSQVRALEAALFATNAQLKHIEGSLQRVTMEQIATAKERDRLEHWLERLLELTPSDSAAITRLQTSMKVQFQPSGEDVVDLCTDDTSDKDDCFQSAAQQVRPESTGTSLVSANAGPLTVGPKMASEETGCRATAAGAAGQGKEQRIPTDGFIMASIAHIRPGAHVRVWWTKAMLRDSSMEGEGRFEAGVVRQVDAPELAPRGKGRTVRFTVYYPEDDKIFSHLLDQHHVEVSASSCQGPLIADADDAESAAQPLSLPLSGKKVAPRPYILRYALLPPAHGQRP